MFDGFGFHFIPQ